MSINLKYFDHLRPEMHEFIPLRRDKVVEIGCGTGGFASSIKGIAELWGIEPDVGAAGIAASRMQRVLIGTFDATENNLPDGYFDIVICNDVIEHMLDHDVFLSSIKKKIAPGGVIVGSVPNVRYFKNIFDLLVLKDWDYKEDGILDRTHLRYFTVKSLQRSLTKAGYQVEELRAINPNIRLRSSLRENVYSLFGALLVGGTFGHSRDTAYLQIAFRAAP